MSGSVLIVGDARDAHARAVKEGLAARGRAADYLDLAALPARSSLSWELPAVHGSALTGSLLLGSGRRVALEEIEAVFFRIARATAAPAGLRADLRPFAEAESRRAVDALLSALPCPVINRPAAIAAHRQKPAQSATAFALSASVPATLLSNDPESVRRFFDAHPGGVVVKPVGGGAYVRRLSPHDLSRTGSIAASPMQYQAYVPGEDVRVYVVGAEVFAGRVVRGDARPVDFRRDPAHRCEATSLAPADVTLCQRIASALGQVFSGLDFRRTEAGQLYFLEANPSPMFLRFAADTGHPILPRLLDLLGPGYESGGSS